MKYITTIFIFTLLLLITTPVTNAVSPTPSPTPKTTPTTAPTSTSDPENINILNQLKDKIASKVAQLNLVQRKGAIGTITNISGTQITIDDVHGNEAVLDVDELTKFSSPSAKAAFGISDLTKGTVIDVLGLYNKQSKRILARFIDVVTLPRYINGEIASLDPDEYTIRIISDDGKMTTVDVENITKTFLYTSDEKLQKAGFSKIPQGKHIVVNGYSDIKDKNRIIALRIIVFPDAAANPRIIIPQDALDPDTAVTPSTGSGTKLTPLTR